MDESNTVVSAYTLHRHLQQYCSHPVIYVIPDCLDCLASFTCLMSFIKTLNPFPNFRLFQTERVCRRQCLMKMAGSSPNR